MSDFLAGRRSVGDSVVPLGQNRSNINKSMRRYQADGDSLGRHYLDLTHDPR
jgi:hypothetical protein